MRIFLISCMLVTCPTYAKIDNNENSNFIVQNYFGERRYKPDWDDLDTRPLPEWYDRAKIGIFLHWGVFSVPSFGSEWFWNYWHASKPEYVEFMKRNYRPGFTYQDFACLFTAEFFNSDSWVDLFKAAGARYVVLTTKHHEGFTLFPSKQSFSWNAADVGPKRDLVGELSKSIKKAGLKFGAYYSLFEWFNPIFREDAKKNYKTREYAEHKAIPDLKQLINEYKPSLIWSDGDVGPVSYWNSTQFLAWLYNDSPVKKEIVVNDRWGKGTSCKHGDFFNCADRYHPGSLQKHKWENAFTLDLKSWGYRRNMQLDEVMSAKKMIDNLVSTVSCGGNVLINVGPTKEGTIPVIFQERLSQLGQWLRINGEAVYETSPWLHQNDSRNTNVWYTCTKTKYNEEMPVALPDMNEVIAVYAIFLYWPKNDSLRVKDVTVLDLNAYKVEMMGSHGVLKWKINDGDAIIKLPEYSTVSVKYAWALKFTRI